MKPVRDNAMLTAWALLLASVDSRILAVFATSRSVSTIVTLGMSSAFLNVER
jgi:hypothetical protein